MTLYTVQLLAPKDGRRNRALKRFAVIANSRDEAVGAAEKPIGLQRIFDEHYTGPWGHTWKRWLNAEKA